MKKTLLASLAALMFLASSTADAQRGAFFMQLFVNSPTYRAAFEWTSNLTHRAYDWYLGEVWGVRKPTGTAEKALSAIGTMAAETAVTGIGGLAKTAAVRAASVEGIISRAVSEGFAEGAQETAERMGRYVARETVAAAVRGGATRPVARRARLLEAADTPVTGKSTAVGRRRQPAASNPKDAVAPSLAGRGSSAASAHIIEEVAGEYRIVAEGEDVFIEFRVRGAWLPQQAVRHGGCNTPGTVATIYKGKVMIIEARHRGVQIALGDPVPEKLGNMGGGWMRSKYAAPEDRVVTAMMEGLGGEKWLNLGEIENYPDVIAAARSAAPKEMVGTPLRLGIAAGGGGSCIGFACKPLQ